MQRKILVVGCGGLGCELVKILCVDESIKLTLVDDDTIDPTNLNRQFFFVKNDVNSSKCEVVKLKLSIKHTNIEINSIFGRIDDYKRIDFYRQFDVVYNCLDNNAARSFVNERCLLANVQLIDGGSAGWLGQSFCNEEECFDCLPKQGTKIYPICNIRQKPKNFEHCLIWAKSAIENEDTIATELKELEKISKQSKDSLQAVEENLSCSEESSTELVRLENEKVEEENIKRKKTADFNTVVDLFYLEKERNVDNTENIYNLACIKAKAFEISSFPFLQAQTFLKNIIPSICTTNAIIASLMVISQKTKKNYYLIQGSQGIIKVEMNKKRHDCFVCGLPTYKASIKAGTTIKYFLELFGGESLIKGSTIFDVTSCDFLDNFDGDIVIVMRNELPNRLYIEIGETEKVVRIR